MELGELVSFYRKQAGLTIDELVERSGVPKGTLTKIIGGNTKAPTLSNMKAIAHALGLRLSDFDDGPQSVSIFTPSEQGIIKKYRSLDGPGQEAVDAILDCEHRRCQDERRHPEKVVELFPTRKYLQSATAGYGDFNDDASYEMIDLVRRPPVGTSFIVTVNGDSMEPTYHDGDQLFVRAQERVELGDIGLFTQGPKLYIKESGPDGLISHNEAYELITGTEDEPIRAQGKILGVCSDEYLLMN